MKRVWHQFYDEGVTPEMKIPEITIYDILENSTEKYPDNPATYFMGARLKYTQLKDHVDRFAAGLKKMGVKKGDRIAVSLPNCPQSVIAFYAAFKLGAVAVGFNPLYVERELIYQFNDSGAETLITLDILWEKRIKGIADEVPLKRIIVTNVKDYLPGLKALFYPVAARLQGMWAPAQPDERVHYFKDVVSNSDPKGATQEAKHEDLALLQYTGGTTGLPKGVMLSHKNIVSCTVAIGSYFTNAVMGKERHISVIPAFHIYGLTMCTVMPVYQGAEIQLIPRFDVNMLLKEIPKLKPTYFCAVPTMYVGIINHPDLKKYDISSIKGCFSGASPLPVSVMKRFEELTGGRIIEGYGLSEAAPVSHANTFFGKRKSASVGFPIPNTDCRLVDIDDGKREVKIGEPGEVVIKGPQVMMGYWNKEEQTREALQDGWLYTGDIATRDEEGFFYIVDRKKDMIIAGGYNIYPREIDEVLYSHPKIQDAVAVGIPDPYRGETVKAFIVLKEGETMTEDEIKAYCKKNLAVFKVPKIYEFKKELPMSMIGKVLRKKLRDEEIEKMGDGAGAGA
ncbi:MAG: long-chain fatty acid--CoA ligase [Deltaproteobacteria bacterium]|uniref:Long-chain fatty acid--CoA ligase n=1 Tax=Candidatus Zymogenus saltonus TaxID=2844893 RepID=A0A9D8KHG4_9DELT|nr:long-chain fatty acid--CoA ligase [Candidatus Zymogenus saltonus]